MTLSGTSAARLVALSHDLMCALDLEGLIVWANPAWQRLLGWDPAELAGRPYSRWSTPRTASARRAAAVALASGQPAWPETELRIAPATARYRWMLFNAVFAREEQARLPVGQGRVRAHGGAAESSVLHARYRALVANLPDTVVTLFDTDLRILVAEGGSSMPQARPELRRLRLGTMPASTPRSALPRGAGGRAAVLRRRDAAAR